MLGAGPRPSGRRRRGGVTAEPLPPDPRWDRPRRLRQGRHAARFPRDVGRLGDRARHAPRRRDPPSGRRRRLRDDRLRPDRPDVSGRARRLPWRRWPRSARSSPPSSGAGVRASPRPVARWIPPGSSPIPVATRDPAGRPARAVRRAAGQRAHDRGRNDRRSRRRPMPRLRALGRSRAGRRRMACGDDGIGVKPDPRMLLAVCEAVADRAGPDRGHRGLAGRPADGPSCRRGHGQSASCPGSATRTRLRPQADLLLPSIADLPTA